MNTEAFVLLFNLFCYAAIVVGTVLFLKSEVKTFKAMLESHDDRLLEHTKILVEHTEILKGQERRITKIEDDETTGRKRIR
jgi:hypothetical protein